MAIALVQQRDLGWSASATSNVRSSFTQNFTVGNKIILWLGVGGAVTSVTVSDNSSQAGTANTYTVIDASTPVAGNTTSMIGAWYCDITRAILTTDTITVSWTTAQVSMTEIIEISGAATGAPQAFKRGSAGSGTAVSTAAFSTAAQTGDFLAMGAVDGAANAYTNGTDGQGNTMTLLKSITGQSRGWGAQDLVESGALAYTPAGTFAASTTWAALAVLISPGVAAPTNSVAPATTYATHRVGQTATTTDGTWTGSPTFTYQWKNASDGAGTGAANATGTGATTATYTANFNDFNKYLACTVTGTNGSGSLAVAGNYLGSTAGNFAASNVVNGRVEMCANDATLSLFTQGSSQVASQTTYYLQTPLIPAYVSYYGS